MDPWDPDRLHVREGPGIERRVLGLALVVELLAHPLADFLGDLAGVDGRVHAAMYGEDPFELLEIRLHGRLHVGILQLAGELLAVLRGRAMDLAERCGGGGSEIEGAEPALPLRSQLRLHAPLHEGRPHGRCLALELLQLGGIFRRDEVRDGRQELRHLHDRALEPAERLRQHRRVGRIARIAPEQPRTCHAGRDPAHIGTHAGIAGGTRGEAVRFAVGIGHDVESLARNWRALDMACCANR